MRPQKSMGGIVIDIWEKSNFFGAFGSQKGAKNAVFLQAGRICPLPFVGLNIFNPHYHCQISINTVFLQGYGAANLSYFLGKHQGRPSGGFRTPF